MDKQNFDPDKPLEQKVDYFKILRIFASRWYWIAGTLLISLITSYLYLRFTPPQFQTSSTVKFDGKRTEFSELITVSNFYDRKDNIQSEMFVLQSRKLLLNAILKMDYKVSYYREGTVLVTETYPQKPFPIEIVKMDSLNFYRGMFAINQLSDKTFELSYFVGKKEIIATYKYGDVIKADNLEFKVLSSNVYGDKTKFLFNFNNPSSFLGRVGGGLNVREVSKGVNIVQLTQTDKNPQFASDFLNLLFEEYRRNDRFQKSLSAEQTIEFIDNQLRILAGQVEASEKKLQNFKTKNKIISIEVAGTYATKELNDKEAQLNILKIQSLAVDLLEEQIKVGKSQVSFNFNIENTPESGLLSGLITTLNGLLLEKSSRQTLYAPLSQSMLEIDSQIEATKKSIVQNIASLRIRNNRTIALISRELNIAKDRIVGIPEKERSYITLQRDFQINEKVYAYLSEKKLEAAISKSAILPGATLVDDASSSGSLISPIPRKIYTSAIVMGILAGISIIVLVRTSNQLIYDKETVESITTIPIIGVIRKYPSELDAFSTQILSLSHPKSVFAESVRSVRTNLSFLAGELGSKTICITSAISGEGKSFLAINLASTLTLIDKKVLIIAADLRKSKIHKTFKIKNDKGLSTYLSNQNSLEQVIIQTGTHNLDFMPSGPNPPNPSELLYLPRMEELIIKLRTMYDYIIIDTAPIGLVSDSIPLVKNADINVFVLRSGVSRTTSASIPQRIYQEYNLKNTVIVLNAFGDDALHASYYNTNYGNYYGNNYYYYSDYSSYGNKDYSYYGEDEIKKSPLWKFWARK